MIKEYPNLKRELSVLEFQLSRCEGIDYDTVISSLTFSKPEGERVQTSGVSDVTARAALAYRKVADRMSDEWLSYLAGQYGQIKEELVSKNLVKDPVVTVEFMNLTVSVLGEVASPGRFNIDKDKLTLLDALSMAGDLTVYGKRENVLVQREENGKQTLYQVNLNSGYDLYASPVYYLQQNDIVYVEPNSMKARQATVNGNNVRSASFWMSLASLLTTITVLIVK